MKNLFLAALGAVALISLQALAVSATDCASALKSKKADEVVLQSNEGHCVTIDIRVANQSKTIANMVEDLGLKTDAPIPFQSFNDRMLVFIANIMTEIIDKGADEKMQIIKNKLPKDNPAQLLEIIMAANYLDIGPDENPQHDRLLLHIGLDMFAQKIFVTDLEKLKGWNESAYAYYKKAFFGKLPKELEKLVINRNLRSIDRVFVNHTKDRRQDAIKQLDLATAQIVAYIAKNVDIASAEKLPAALLNELKTRKFTDKIFFGPMPTEFAIWPRHCPLPGHPDYNMYSDGTPDERYEDNTDGTITDVCTKLTWEKAPSTPAVKWVPAKTHCAKLNKANFKDWRTPTRIELHTLVDYTKRQPALNRVFDEGTGWFWSGSPLAGNTDFAWVVYFNGGGVNSGNVDDSFRVRCVR